MRQCGVNDKITELMRKSYPYQVPHVNELEAKNVLMLINIHPSIDFPEPLPPNTIAVGGIQIKEGKSLPKVGNPHLNHRRCLKISSL